MSFRILIVLVLAGVVKITATHFAKAGHFVFIDPQSDIWADVLKSVRQTLAMPQ